MSKRANSGKSGGAQKKLKYSAESSLPSLPEELERKLDFKPEINTAEGRPWNFKIVCWNVNGIRAVVKSKKIHYLRYEDPDVICLQETKCAEADIPEESKFEGYCRYYNSAEKKGYSSTALFSKTAPLSVTYGINAPQHDREGRVITAEFPAFYLINVYVPNSGQKTVRLSYRREWNKDFLAYCKRLDGVKPVIVAGDLNVAHTEIDLANPKGNTKNSGFTPEEREDFTTWLEAGFTDSYRYFNPEKTGAYTFWTYMGNARRRNVGWRIDYFLCSNRLMNKVAGNLIRDIVLGSDHCPLMLLLDNQSNKVGKVEKVEKVEIVGKVEEVGVVDEKVKETQDNGLGGDVKQEI